MAGDAPSWRKEDEEEDEDEEDIDETGYKTVKDAVLFAIDVSKSMLTPPPPSDSKKADRDTATSAALKCAYHLMQQRIISNPNDMMGILLFGTEQTKVEDEAAGRGNLSYPHCYQLVPLDVPSADDVKRLKSLVEDEEEAARLLVPSEEPVSMANLLFCANQIFTTKAPNFTSRRLFLVTDNDDPHEDDRLLRNSAAVGAKDLYDLGVVIELFPISRPGHNFARSKFYDDIIYRSSSSDPEAPIPFTSAAKTSTSGDGISLLQSLLSSINSKATARRALFSNLSLEIGPGLKISVKGYIIFKRQEPVRSCYIWLGGEKPQLAVGKSNYMAEDTARTVEKAEIRKAYSFGGETVTFTKEEVASLRNFGDPVIRIIGFKPLDMLPIWATTRPSTFIYPSEDDFVGSTRVFAALQQKLLKDQKMGLVWYIPRKNAAPVLAALIPGAEKLDDDGVQEMPPGLWIHPLPFADDIRQNPETTLVKADEKLIDLMRTVIQQLQLPKGIYDPSKYPNPSLQWFYRILQALALMEDIPEHPDDKTIPKYRQIDKRAGPYVLDWGVELENQHRAHEQSTSYHRPLPTHKRSAPSSASSANKKVKKEDNGGPDDGDMRMAYEKGGIGKMTVADLKEWLATKGLHTSGKKAELVDRVTDYFEKK